MSVIGTLVEVTLRSLLGRRRMVLLILLVSVPVLIGVIVRLSGGRPDPDRVLDALVVRTVMPLVALVLGTAALGSEIEDGTAVYLMVKPIARWRIALAKIAVAAALTATLIIPSIVVTGLLVGGAGSASLGSTFAFALACLIGGSAYAAAFVTLSVFTSRALLLGLAYTLLWEGALAGLLEGTRFLSIRQATLGLAAGFGADIPGDQLAFAVSVVVLTTVLIGSFLLATWRLDRFEIRGSD